MTQTRREAIRRILGMAGGAGGAALGALVPACRRRRAGGEVAVYTSIDQVFAEPVLRALEARGTTVRAVFDTEETKSTGVFNRIVAEARSPRADVFWSGDPMRALALVEKGLAEPYVSPQAAAIPTPFKAADGSWTGSSARARVLLVNEKRLGVTERPTSIRDLANARFKGEAAIANPLFGTTTMHVAALFANMGDGPAKDLLRSFRANGVRVASSNGEVKRLVVSGEVKLGVVDTDDAHEALDEKAPVAVVYPDQDTTGTLLLPTTVVLIRGGPHADAGRRLVDHLLSAEVERMLANAAAHIPLRNDVVVPGVTRLADLRVMSVDYARIAREMERIEPWLRAWVGM